VLRLPHYTDFLVCLRGSAHAFSCSFVLQYPFPIAFGGTPGRATTRLAAIHGALEALEATVRSERAQAFLAPEILAALDAVLCDSELIDNLLYVWRAIGSADVNTPPPERARVQEPPVACPGGLARRLSRSGGVCVQ